VHLTSEGIDDELDVFCWDTLNGFLDDVVTILVLYAFENVGTKFLDKFGLLISQDMFESLMMN
jgi:hypothetical protein